MSLLFFDTGYFFLMSRLVDPRIITDKQMSNDETAVMVGLISLLISIHIFTGRVYLRPVINIETTNSSNEMMKAKIALDITPGRIIGNVTFKNVFKRLAPRLNDAYSISILKSVSAAETVTKTKGNAMMV